MRKNTFWLVLCGGGAGLLALVCTPAIPSSPAVATVRPPPPPTQAERRAMAEDFEAHRAAAARRVQDDEPDAPRAGPSGPPDIVTEAESTARTARRLDALMAGEVRDDAWADAAERDFEDVAQAPGVGVIASRAECRATLCRVEVQLDAVAPPDFLEQVATSEPWNGGGWWEATGDSAVTVYVARAGHPLTVDESGVN